MGLGAQAATGLVDHRDADDTVRAQVEKRMSDRLRLMQAQGKSSRDGIYQEFNRKAGPVSKTDYELLLSVVSRKCEMG